MEVVASITNISWIEQVTMLQCTVNNGWLDFSKFAVFVEFSADDHGLNSGLDF